ncbi:hypothetical protein PVAP13_2NG306000 [Panicum virgatum]|uniref:Uncharacterized protein n=1 Tax=Panicum virgatum TaxID=38727 RepID=A0A8T0VN40_PANVG|nr:hypothetical protein PVAP13_2NG306000 [Panicum virgatum]
MGRNTYMLQFEHFLCAIQIKEQSTSTICCHKNRSRIMLHPRILIEITLPQILCSTCSVKATRGSKRFLAQFVNDQ